MEYNNMLRIDTLGEGWCDKDNVMLHVCFQILSDAVEKDNLVNKLSEETESWYIDARHEVMELYNWWQSRKNEETKRFSMSGEEDHDTYLMENTMLKKLIDIRIYCWT